MSTTRDTASKSTEMSSADPKTTVPQVCGMCGSNAKLNCSRCHHILYCSKECQIKDWPTHKSVCKFLGRPLGPLPQIVTYDHARPAIDNDKAFFQAVLISMDYKVPDPSRDTHRFSGTFLHGMNASSPRFVELHATTALGMPLGMADCSQVGLKLQNFRVAYMMLDSDPQSPTFGQQPQMEEVPEAGDEENVGEGTVERPTINPAAFARVFKVMKEKAVADGDTQWVGVECPVLVEGD
ncbi:Zinc finger MYND domain-containing protein 10 [Elasticomyces elasticus]|nr:Zinc finger MYND domain-containing protein 10 [Elasticomyces elasticus]